VVSYKELIGFVWKFMRRQKGVFFLILILDSIAWPVESIVWPYILHVVIDIFIQFEGDRIAAWAALKAYDWCSLFSRLYGNCLPLDGFFNGKSGP
jgi:hypothetical protein